MLIGTAPATAAPDPAVHDATDAGDPVVVRLGPGSDPDAAARDAAARGARIRFVYHDVFPGYAAVLPPGGLRGVEGGPDVVTVEPDVPVRVRDGMPGTDRAGGGAVGARPRRPAGAAAVRDLHAARDGPGRCGRDRLRDRLRHRGRPPRPGRPGAVRLHRDRRRARHPRLRRARHARGRDDRRHGVRGGAGRRAGRGAHPGLRGRRRDLRGDRRNRLGRARPPHGHPGRREPEPERAGRRERRRRDPRPRSTTG